MTIKKSKPYAIEGITFAGGKVNYDFQNNKLIGIKGLNSNNVFQPIPRTDPDFQKSISGDALSSVRRAYNIVKHGEDKQAYEDTFQISSDEEIDARYDQSYQSFLNAGFVDNNFDKPKPFAYTTQRKGSDSRSSSEVMAYPIDISTEQDHFKITKFKYQRNNINQSKPASKETNIAGDSVKGSQIKGSILLPMPKATDVNGVEWGNSDLTVTGLAALGAAEKAAEAGGAVLDAMNPFSDKGFGVKRMLNGGDVQGNTLFKNEEQRKASQEFKRNGQGRKGPTGSDVMAAGQAMAIQSITNTAASAFGTQIDADVALGRTGGRVLNPNAEMLFQGPVIRDFTFSFIMIARSEQEGKMIRRIVRFLKLGMAPKFQNTTFLSFPDIFQLEYRNASGKLKTVNQFNPGGLALTTMNVDYAPNGYWSAYSDSQPVAMKMDLNFTELRPIFEGDQDNTPEDSVGF